MLDKYKFLQPNFFNFVNFSFNNNKISHAYLIETNGVDYALDLAFDLAKFFLCDGVYDERVCSLVDLNSYDDFMYIDSVKEIKKESIIDLKNVFSRKALNKRKVYLIKDAALLNKSSSNSLLKFLEEPEDDIIAILVVKNVKLLLDTITSRCQIVSLVNNSVFNYKNIFSYFDEANDGDFDDFVDRECLAFTNFYKNIEENGVDVLGLFDVYSFSNRFKQLLDFGFYFYLDLLNSKLSRNVDKYLPSVVFDSIIVDNSEINDIIKKIDVINEFRNYSLYNVNMNLFIDNFIIMIGGV